VRCDPYLIPLCIPPGATPQVSVCGLSEMDVLAHQVPATLARSLPNVASSRIVPGSNLGSGSVGLGALDERTVEVSRGYVGQWLQSEHLSDPAFQQVFRATDVILVATHAGARLTCEVWSFLPYSTSSDRVRRTRYDISNWNTGLMRCTTRNRRHVRYTVRNFSLVIVA